MDSSNDNHPVFHGTTILSVRRQTPQGLQVAIGGDGQVTLGNIIVKGTARKVRKLYHGKVLAGFAGATADRQDVGQAFDTAEGVGTFDAIRRFGSVEVPLLDTRVHDGEELA